MGNNLCKEQTGGRGPGSSKNPVERFLGGCMKMCPGQKVKKEYNWNKHVYETRPPRQSQPITDDGWKTITLPRSHGSSLEKAADVAPVPPPRKKRTSMLSLNKDGVKNGFKDVFGSSTPRRYSCDSVHNSKRYRERGIDTDMPVRNSVSCHMVYDDGFSDFSKEIASKNSGEIRKILPKVGNKKSDKFFGENLSDLSDEGDKPEKSSYKTSQSKLELERTGKDPIERFIEENAPEKLYSEVHRSESPSSKDSLDRKAKFLINMLEQYSKEPCYDGREPVEEAIIVPRKKITRHICDKDDFHKHFHKHEKEESEKCLSDCKDSEDTVDTEPKPKKPQRDFEIYRKSQENLVEKSESEKVQAPIRRKKSINREDLPSPPARPQRMSDSIVLSKSQENLLSPSPTKDLELETPKLVLNLISTKTKTVTPPPSPDVPRRVEISKQVERIISQTDSVPSTPETPDTPETPETPTDDLPKTPQEQEKLKKKLKKSHSSNTFLTQDVIKKMKARVLEYQMSTEYVTEDIDMSKADGSHLVQPTSKIEKPKKKISNASTCTIETESAEDSPVEKKRGKSSIAESIETSSTVSTVSQPSPTPSVVNEKQVTRKAEDKKDVTELPAEENLFNKSSLIQAESSLAHILESENLDMKIISDVLDDIYNKSVLEEFQNYLENEGTDMNELMAPKNGLIPKLTATELERPIATSPVLTEKRGSTKSTKSNRSSQPNIVITKEAVNDDNADARSIDSISDDGYSQLIKTHSKEDISSNAMLAVVQAQGRRESIVDVDNWFNNHIETPDSSENILSVARMERRGSDFLVGYDTKTVFPFGKQQRSRQDSVSSEFFEDRNLSKSVENLKGSNQSLNKDHSGLLKYLVEDSEKTNAKNAKNRSLSDSGLSRSNSKVDEPEEQDKASIPSIMVTEDGSEQRGKSIREKLLKDSLSD